MALKVKAKEQYQNIGKYAGKYRYVMMPELYTGSNTGGGTQSGDNTSGGSTGDNGDRDPDGGTNSDE